MSESEVDAAADADAAAEQGLFSKSLAAGKKLPPSVSYTLMLTFIWVILTVVWLYVGMCWICSPTSSDISEIVLFHTPHTDDGKHPYERDAKDQLRRLIRDMRSIDDRVVYRAWYGNTVRDSVPDNVPKVLSQVVNFNVLAERTFFIIYMRHPVDYAHNNFLTPFLPDKEYWLSRTAVDDARLLVSDEARNERWKDKVWWNGLTAFQSPDAIDIQDFLGQLLPVNRDKSEPVLLPRPYGRLAAHMTELLSPQKYTPERTNKPSNGFVMGPFESALCFGCNDDHGKDGSRHAHGSNRVYNRFCGNFRLHGDDDGEEKVGMCGDYDINTYEPTESASTVTSETDSWIPSSETSSDGSQPTAGAQEE